MKTHLNLCFVSVFMNYFDNPGGMIPTWLVNWAAKVSARIFILLPFISVSTILLPCTLTGAGVNHFQLDQKSFTLLKPDYTVK